MASGSKNKDKQNKSKTSLYDETSHLLEISDERNKGDGLGPGSKVKFYIYFSHFMTKWSERMWAFAVGLYMIHLTPNSLQLTAIYGLTTSSISFFLGPVAGDWVDSVQRMRAATVTMVLQTILVVADSACIYFFLMFRESVTSVGSWFETLSYAVIILLAALSVLANSANTITIERDWVVEMCRGDDGTLAVMTARMKSIDLTTQLLAPVITGQALTFLGVQAGAIFLAAWNLVTLVFEYFLIWKVYHSMPALRVYKDVSKSVGQRQKAETSSTGCCLWLMRSRMFSRLVTMVRGWRTFASYDVVLSGISLAFLFLTVLGFDSVTVGFCKMQGLSDAMMGIMTGIAGLFGILGTMLYPCLQRGVGLPRSGMVGLVLMLVCLSMCVVSLWLPGSMFELYPNRWEMNNTTTTLNTAPDFFSYPGHPVVSVFVLLAGIITARTGLWTADLSINQMFMKTVKKEERGVVFGVSYAQNQLLNIVKFGLVAAFPLGYQFGYLVIISYSSILLSAVIYLIFLSRLTTDVYSQLSTPASKGYTKI